MLMKINRRVFVSGSLAVGALSFTQRVGASANAPIELPLGIADITVRKELQADYPATVRRLREMGYTHLGMRLFTYFPGEPPEPTPAEKARYLQDTGMKAGPIRFSPARPLGPQIEAAHLLGAEIMVLSGGRVFLSGITPRVPTLAELEAYYPELNDLGREIAGGGLKFAYHNHGFDAVEIQGEKALDRTIKGTDPDLVSFELDLAWAYLGGYDPVKLAQKMGRRLVSMHFKDVDRERSDDEIEQLVGPGEGDMEYESIIRRLQSVTNALKVVEIDAPADGLASAQRALTFIKGTLSEDQSGLRGA